MPPSIVLCTGVDFAFGAHHELVLDPCTMDRAVGTDCFSCLLARAEPQKGEALQILQCNGSGWLCVHII